MKILKQWYSKLGMTGHTTLGKILSSASVCLFVLFLNITGIYITFNPVPYRGREARTPAPPFRVIYNIISMRIKVVSKANFDCSKNKLG